MPNLADSTLLAILNATYNGIITVDIRGIIMLVNPAAERIMNARAVDVVGRLILNVIPNSGLPEVLATGEVQTGRKLMVGGTPVISNRTPLYQDGAIVGAVAVIQEVCDLEQISDQLQIHRRLVRELEAVIDSSDDGIYIADGKGVTLRVNRAYERITGIRKEQVEGEHLADLVQRGFFRESGTLLVLERKEPVTILQRILGGKDAIVTSTPVLDDQGEISMVVTSVRDITRLNTLRRELEETKALSNRYREELQNVWLAKSGFVGESREIRRVMDLAAQVAPFPTTVLVEGESGVGKELVATAIHRQSKRADGPFIKVNCGAIPEQLLESELYGYDGGAFTGARREGKPGMFELADGGTLLLDEIDALPLNLQVKLLRVMQEREVMRLGATRPKRVDVRLVSATNKNLEAAVAEGLFREDLFYRVNVVRITVPPLRERKDDIPLLLQHFLAHFCQEYGLEKSLAPDVIQAMVTYHWPGNVREMRNMLENLVVSTAGAEITRSHLPLRMAEQTGPKEAVQVHAVIPLREAIDQLERQLLERALAQKGSLRQAAILLGVDHATVVRKARRLKLAGGNSERN
jgi:PAS domain S-box-containing protein